MGPERQPAANVSNKRTFDSKERRRAKQAASHPLVLAAPITQTFGLATADAVRRLQALGVPTVGVDDQGNIVQRAPDGTKTVIGRSASPRQP